MKVIKKTAKNNFQISQVDMGMEDSYWFAVYLKAC